MISPSRCFVAVCCLLFFISSFAQDSDMGKKYYDEAMIASDNYKTDKAYKLLIKSSDEGYLEAHKTLAYWYNNFYGRRGTAALVFKYKLRAAEAGDLESMRDIAESYQKGNGTAVNLNAAVEWYVKGIAKGDVLAKLKYCAYYFDKTAGNDPEKGNQFEREKDSLYAVAYSLEEALNGSPDKDKSNWFYTALSEAGYAKASYRLAKTNYVSITKDTYFNLAREQGFPVPQEEIDNNMAFIKMNKADYEYRASQYKYTGPNTTTTTTVNKKVCPECNGNGSFRSHETYSDGRVDKNGVTQFGQTTTRNCTRCSGKGYITD